jgi:G6PDH family F420-dependent oxidoreductase
VEQHDAPVAAGDGLEPGLQRVDLLRRLPVHLSQQRLAEVRDLGARESADKALAADDADVGAFEVADERRQASASTAACSGSPCVVRSPARSTSSACSSSSRANAVSSRGRNGSEAWMSPAAAMRIGRDTQSCFPPWHEGTRRGMTAIGYTLSAEEHRPDDLVRHAQLAERAGFTFALISDHFHPWIDRQGQSAFVWAVLGGIAQRTSTLRIGTGVTCPLLRIHPAIVAQAAATTASMLPGRFFLGVGTGEELNEHILAQRWPSTTVRREMLEEAVELIRKLWEGELTSHSGRHYTVENARIYTLPDEPPPIAFAASGPEAAELAGRLGDALVTTAPDASVVETYREAGGSGPRYGQLTVCWGEDEAAARKTAHEWWPNAPSW